MASRAGEAGQSAQGYIGALAARKDFLYRASERSRVAARVVETALGRASPPRMLLFHERVSEAEKLYESLHAGLPNVASALEHSDLPAAARRDALKRFRSGDAQILVSVKSLVEGIDVPDADVGVSVASSSSVRQRIQTLGRVLRRRFDGVVKQAEMHVIYVHKTVDESIYGKEDWSDLTGEDANRYWLWPLDPDLPSEAQPGPPLQPRPTEEAEWQRFGGAVPLEPAIWLGELSDSEFSVDTRGNVVSPEGAGIENPQGVSQMVERVRGRPGGRFRLTPLHNLVIVFGESAQGMVPYLAGQVTEPFRIREESVESFSAEALASLGPGDAYPGPTDREMGTFKLRQKRGGVIERSERGVSAFAITEGDSAAASNGRRLLDAWKSLKLPGMTVYVNQLWHAWYRTDGEPRYLANVEGGFAWPESDTVNDTSSTPDTSDHSPENTDDEG